MPAYPSEQFSLLEHEKAEIEALSKLIQAKAVELGSRHNFSLSCLEAKNATLTAWESWCGEDGYGRRHHSELDQLSRRLRRIVQRISNRGKNILSKRIRKPRTAPLQTTENNGQPQ